MKKIITNDLFNISSRIKKINKDYFIIFNKNKHRYEVHINQKGSNLAFCLGGTLNSYALKKAITTSCKFTKSIIKNVIESNKKLEKQNEQNFVNKHIETLNRYLSYASSKDTNVTF